MQPRHRTTVLVVGSTDACARVAQAIDAADDLELFGVVATADADATVASGAPDIVVVSADPDGLGVARRVAVASAATRTVAIDVAGLDPDTIVDSGIGALACDAAPAVLAVVRGLARGEGFIDASVARCLLDRHEAPGVHPLTPTEDEVLHRLAAGDTTDEIAADYAVSPRLVRLHAGGPLARLLPT
ncbi:MAG: response regulator transcription factor [Acidimicrobiia bacterium]|nr:response regulator transcription factor [Acidimicrobiia bacterium]